MQGACAIFSSMACPALRYFSTLSHKRHDLEKKKSYLTQNVCWCSLQLLSETSHSKKKWARYDKKCISVFMYRTLYSCQILMELEFSLQIFIKSSIIKFHENPSSGSHVVPCGRTDMTKVTVAYARLQTCLKTDSSTCGVPHREHSPSYEYRS